MPVRIITDSGCDIIDSDRTDLTVLPLSIAFGETTYRDGVDLDHERFYELLVESDELPTTGQVTPYAFREAFAAAVEAGEDVVAITLSSKLSGTNQSAVVAAAEFPDHVHVVDSLNVCAGEHILVDLALRLVDQGLDAATIAAELNAARKDVRVVALLDTLEYLRKGGRISSAAGAIGQMLSVKPVIGIVDGEVAMLGKARGSKNGRNLLTQQVEAAGGIDFDRPVLVGYSGLSDALLGKYVKDSMHLWEDHVEEVPVCTVGATIGTHVGPNAIVVSFFGKGN